MNLIETETCQAIIDRMKAFLPDKMQNSVLPYLDRPEELTEDVLSAVHPSGLYLVQFVESASEDGEAMIFGVYTVAMRIVQGGEVTTSALDQTYKMTRAAKIIVTGLAPFAGHKLSLHEDKPVIEEAGVIMRCVSFRLINPTLPLSDTKIAAKIAELAL